MKVDPQYIRLGKYITASEKVHWTPLVWPGGSNHLHSLNLGKFTSWGAECRCNGGRRRWVNGWVSRRVERRCTAWRFRWIQSWIQGGLERWEFGGVICCSQNIKNFKKHRNVDTTKISLSAVLTNRMNAD